MEVNVQTFKEMLTTNKFLMMWLHYIGQIKNVCEFTRFPFDNMQFSNLHRRLSELTSLGLVNKKRYGREVCLTISEDGKKLMEAIKKQEC